MSPPGLSAFTALTLLLSVAPAAEDGPLYGRVTTADGEVIEGFIRWDRNEAALGDFLDGQKPLSPEQIREAERLDPDFAARQREARSIVAFGMRITWDEDDQSDPPASASAVRFGHVASLVAVDRRSALVELTSGESVTMRSASSDLGRSMRELLVTERDGTEHDLRWSELDRIEFIPAPADLRAPASRRLYGTVTTWSDLEVAGAIAWDLDEILVTDILDGRADGEDMEIPFGDIRAIEWESDRAARVILNNGERMVLRGTNDVNRENRGIEVSDPALGRRVVPWEDFRSVRFHKVPESTAWTDFAPGAAIRGTAYAADGRVLEGAVRWNNDQGALWEALSGWVGDSRVWVEFGAIRTIDKIEDDMLRLELRSGRTIELDYDGPTNEVIGSPGVYVTPDGRAPRLILWRDFDRLELGG